MLFNIGSSFQITDYRGFDYQFDGLERDRPEDVRAVLDSRTARDLFARQGDIAGYQTAERLLLHFTQESQPK
ncbi:MAG: hypothetical protein AAFQ41_14280 [Cyanobacteria bacterium J06623_7]